jgi:hypothetical protein
MNKSNNEVNLLPVIKKYLNRKLFEEDQIKFKQDFFKELFDPTGYINYSKWGTTFINAILQEEGIPFLVEIYIDKISNNKEVKYWLICEI